MNESSTVIYGLDEEYHNIDISEVKGTDSDGASELYLMPTQDSSLPPAAPSMLPPGVQNPLEFIDSTSGDVGEVTGSVDTTSQTPQGSEWGSLKHRHPPGKAASFLESKGFGWLLEVEEDEEELKPLL